MSGRIPIGRAILMMTVVTAVGYGIMVATTPTEQQFYDSLAPDLKKKVDDGRKMKANADEKMKQLEAMKRSADSGQPVWVDSPPRK